MEYLELGNSGLKVSRVCLGCMSYGEPGRGSHPWSLTEEESRPILEGALDLGINFFDTANIYSEGSSEEILGRIVLSAVPREDLVIATKVFDPMRSTPNARGLSRKAVLHELDESLRRLGTDYVDIYQVHHWDYVTPIEETLEVLSDVVRMGKALYIGASAMFAWQLCKCLMISEARGWKRFISIQDHYNLLNREHEREMAALCADQGVGVLAWSPLARGRLARPGSEVTGRMETDEFGKTLYRDDAVSDRRIVQAVGDIASSHGVSRAEVALAWLWTQGGVVAPIVGATRLEHVKAAVSALDVTLSEAEVRQLEEPYEPRAYAGFW